MAKNLYVLYNLGTRGNIRGKAAEGFIRPTIMQFFTQRPVFEEIPKTNELLGYTDDLCEGGAAAQSTTPSSEYAASKAFDNDPLTFQSTIFYMENPWIRYDFGEGNEKRIEKYTLAVSDAPGADNLNMPKDFKIFGSVDGSSWVELDSRTGETFVQGPPREFFMENKNHYRFYRLNSYANNHSGLSKCIQIGEMEMMEAIYG